MSGAPNRDYYDGHNPGCSSSLFAIANASTGVTSTHTDAPYNLFRLLGEQVDDVLVFELSTLSVVRCSGSQVRGYSL